MLSGIDETTGRRFAFLVEVGHQLSSSLDPREMLTRLADLLVGELADFLETLNLDESRNYVKRILVLADSYRQLYPSLG